VRPPASAWIVVAAAAVLAGCAIGPDYKRPAVADPQTFRGQGTAEAASLADAPWWELFQDPSLKYAALDSARAQLAKAQADLTRALDTSVVDRARAQLEQRKADRIKSQQDVNRYRPLAEARAIPQENFDTAAAPDKVAVAAVVPQEGHS
jgi:hypothetical protein